MARPQPKQETTLCLRHVFNAPRETVFRAWTDPQALTQWFAPAEGFITPVVEVDLRVGGAYRIEMLAPDGKRHRVNGVYREIQPPQRLVFTWSGEGCEAEPVDTLVTLEFHAKGDATEVVLVHENFSSLKDRDVHDEGWNGCLASLGRFLQPK